MTRTTVWVLAMVSCTWLAACAGGGDEPSDEASFVPAPVSPGTTGTAGVSGTSVAPTPTPTTPQPIPSQPPPGTSAQQMAGTGGAGGTMAAPAAGTGGAPAPSAGTGGAPSVDTGACVDLVVASGTDAACAECLCTQCPSELMNCQGHSDPTWAAQCAAVVDCAGASCCQGTACYTSNGYTIDGPCVAEIDAAGGGAVAVQFMMSCDQLGPPPGNACAASTNFGTCVTSKCALCRACP